MSEQHSGACFCGAVQFTVTGEPNLMGYCHCRDCAEWAGAPVNAFSLWPADAVSVTAGENGIGSYAKTPNSHRKFCTHCGGHIFTDHPSMGVIDVYLDTVPTKTHTGTVHVFYGEKTLSVPDGLPKYKDTPEEFGGSGEMLPE